MFLSILIGERTYAQSTASTTIAATVCGASSRVTLTKPVADSVVTSSTVDLQGTVHQASQIVVRIDGQFNGVIPLSIGQTSFNDSVELGEGTHTILVTAINICSPTNGSDSAVVTYSPSTNSPSVGSETSTITGGVVKPGDKGVKTTSEKSINTLENILEPLGGVAQWLNIDTGSKKSGSDQLSLTRAAVVTVGLVITVLGVAPSLIGFAANMPAVANVFSGVPVSRRMMLLGWAGRLLGVALIVGALFF